MIRKLIPWWHHPNHRYVGRHRGTYQFGNNQLMMPYGLRTVHLTPYMEATGHNVPNSVSLSFALVDKR